MPSKGTPRVTVRIPTALQEEIVRTMTRRNDHSINEPWDFSGFVLNAVREKLAKMERGRKRHGRKRVGKVFLPGVLTTP